MIKNLLLRTRVRLRRLFFISGLTCYRLVVILSAFLWLNVSVGVVKAQALDWLLDPSPFRAKATMDDLTGRLTLSNGLVERIIATRPGTSTISLRNLVSGEQYVRSVSPEGTVTLDGRLFPIGGLKSQPVHNFLREEWIKDLVPLEGSYRFQSFSISETVERFPWKKRPEWLSSDLPWPTPGKRLVLTFAPPENGGDETLSALQGETLLEENFNQPLNDDWKIVLSPFGGRTSVANEGKPGEIYAQANTCAYLERSWPERGAAISVRLDLGDDEETNSWGPGVAVRIANRWVSVAARGNSRQYEICVDGKTFWLDGDLDPAEPIEINILNNSQKWFCQMKQAKRSPLKIELPLSGQAELFRVGKVGKGGLGIDNDTPGSWRRSHLLNISCYAAPETTKKETRSKEELAVQAANRAARLPAIDVCYEIYDGIPLISKWLVVRNTTASPICVDRFVSEELRLVEPESTVDGKTGNLLFNLFVESDYTFGGMAQAQENSKAAQILPDPDYPTQVNYARQERCLLRCSPELGPAQTIEPGAAFESFRIFELLFDSTERERRGLAMRQMYRTIAPWTAENPLMFHKVNSQPEEIRQSIKQCKETGFELIIMSFGSGFNLESSDPAYRAVYKGLADEARQAGVALGGYSLTSSRGAATGADNVQTPSPRFGVGPCLGSKWGQDYLATLKSFLTDAGFGVFENDGPYPGDWCAATTHPGHRGKDDSVWIQWKAQSDLYKYCRAHGIYVNQPDGYFLNGGNKTGMGYRETNWSLPREEQLIIERQNIYDGTWTKTCSMGWMFVPLSQYHGGGAAATIEPLREHLDHYNGRFANLIGAGVQACYRGPRLFDAPETLAVVRKWVDFYKAHRQVLDGNLIHLRRADGRDWDGWLHVNPQGEEKGLAFLYNPLTEPIERQIKIPLYYTGLKKTAQAAINGLDGLQVELDETAAAIITVKIPAQGYVWILFK